MISYSYWQKHLWEIKLKTDKKPDAYYKRGIKRSIEVTGLSKEELIEKMKEHSIEMNQLGTKLWMADEVVISTIKHTVETVTLNVEDLALLEGGTLNEILKKAELLGLKPCPLEIAFYLRFNCLDQTESVKHSKGKVPHGAITVASRRIIEDEEFPVGFYLRNIGGQLWLRGYKTSDDYIWPPEASFVFMI